MTAVSSLWRLIRTGATFERTGAMREALETLDVPPALRVAARVIGRPFAWLGLKGDESLPPVVRALSALGPAYIKFGQVLSTRPDVVGPVMAQDLRVLQDKLPPFDEAEARAEVLRELGAPVEELFSEFSPPIAAASIAQVHRAVMRDDGRAVAVKILRPGIERAFRRDVDAFFFAARMVELLSPSSRRLRPTAVIEHFSSVVRGELDLRMEASAAGEFRANTAEDPGFRVPEVIWPLSARRVLTTEWVSGTAMGDVPALTAEGQDMKGLAASVVQTFLHHALRDGFFHGDMHQGNLKVGPGGEIIALDFGIMGRIDAYTRRVYAEILMGFLKKDYRRVAEVHFEAGYVPADRDVSEFAQALRSIGEPIFGQDSSRISMGRLLAHLFDVTERFGMETQTQLILLQRTMVVVEGVGRSLDPNMNMWEVARPVVESYIRDNLGPKAVLRDLAGTARILSRFGPLLPQMAEELLIRTNRDMRPVEAKPLVPVWIWTVGGVVVGAVAGAAVAAAF
ncbi:2-polyprenylphenol 6-hydroxylase [Paroceanicella profunda]|uniref:2-polyprenylphenol 6-hydroxylase n=1 Tax=Paroceanicella profunda TaxID=2579971 RepID=A0A5B8FIQ5_9RHOB|nr:2-polyprenylphenol 6-hydroxylase [Paroceanicella profunda]QDL93507.1 2-polyprenylphenol 6-hydroxylase [Paroceanicella profunda]